MKETLKLLGLSKNEIEIYLTLLRLGSSIVSKIAESSGIYRPYVYDTLERLSEKGLVSFVIKDNKKYFRAINPNKLLEIETQKLEELNKIIPRLNELISRPKEQTNVELYSGKSVIRVIQRNILEVLSKTKEKRENLVIGVDEKRFMEIDPIIMEQFFNQMKKNKFKEKVLVREGDTFLPAKKTTTEYKFLPKKHFEPTSTFIYGNKIAIVIFTEPLYGLIIENKILANTYRKQFNLLWKIAKQNP